MKPFEDITSKDVENEELELLHHRVIFHAATVPYTQDSTTEKEGSKKVVSASTIVNYFGIMKNLMRCKFPNHPEWPQSPSDNPTWYKELVTNFKKEYERSARTWSKEDYHRGSNKIRALYRYSHEMDLDPDDLHAMARWYGSDPVGKGVTPSSEMGRDLNTICTNLFINATPLKPESYSELGLINTIAAACTRPNEPKYFSWNDVHWEPHMEAIALKKLQQKTLTKNWVCMVAKSKESVYLAYLCLAQASFVSQARGSVGMPLRETALPRTGSSQGSIISLPAKLLVVLQQL